MIKAFYANPQTFEPEVQQAFAFPDQKKMAAWRQQREEKREGPLDTVMSRPGSMLALIGIGITISFTKMAMGPHGDAMKIIRNNQMSPIKYYGLRAVPFAVGGMVLYYFRSQVDYSNPYSRGELK